jgi:hypothetical protein
MHIDAMLCDFATVREGLLHVLGGGINRLWRDRFPAAMGVSLAMVLEVHPIEASRHHRMTIVLQDQDGKRLAEMDADFQLNRIPDHAKPGERIIMPMSISLQSMSIPVAGTYSVEILVDGQHKRSLAVVAEAIKPNDRRRRERTLGGEPTTPPEE